MDQKVVHTKLRTVEKDDTQVVDIQVYDDTEVSGCSSSRGHVGAAVVKEQPEASADDRHGRSGGSADNYTVNPWTRWRPQTGHLC